MPPQTRVRVVLLGGVILAALLLFQIARPARMVASAVQAKFATFRGRILFAGRVPIMAPVATAVSQTSADLRLCGIEEVPNDSLIVDFRSHGIANVFVYLEKLPKGMPATLRQSQEPIVEFWQQDLRFVPHALLLRTDQTLHVRQKDNVGHHAHFYSFRNPTFGEAIKASDEIVPRVFARPERQPLQVKCDIHPWMQSWCLVLDHPYAAITDANGAFEIAELPTGTHEFTVWHERTGFLTRTLKVNIDGKTHPKSLEIRIPSSKFQRNH